MGKSFNDIVSSAPVVLVDYFAEWCGPCKALAPVLTDLKKELGDAVKIVKIDIDKNQALASKQQVQGVPTLVLYKNGTQVWRQSGVLPKHELIKLIQSHQ
ncbi:MAG TPA: thioredoxin [Flavobacteriaceae bacterium]|nr:thioredoxin [Flavobacteriaceae bacterium]